MIRKFTLLFLIFFVFQLSSRAQREHKRVPFFNTFNTAKLAAALTNGLESDSLKVRAIHSWITRNIRYDVRKYLNFDYNHIPVKKILTKRKAICTGYADLFNELCSKAGITATYISGYTRNENTDLFDPFYVEDHMWNAVYINDQWKLVDPTWDAGYIDYYRKTFAGWIVWGATFGRNTILRYKPHFVRMPHNGFLMRSGTFFISDHIPLDPNWQMINPPRTIEVCENDSHFYFKKRIKNKQAGNGNYLNIDRSRLASLNQNERTIAEGYKAYEYNPKNYFALANAEFTIATLNFQQLMEPNTDKGSKKTYIDSLERSGASSAIYFDSTMSVLQRQKEYLIANNRKKKAMMNTQQMRLKGSTAASQRTIKSGITTLKGSKKKFSEIVKNVEKQEEVFLKNEKYIKTRVASKTNSVDSALAADHLAAYQDSVAIRSRELDQLFRDLDHIYGLCLGKIKLYREGSLNHREQTISLIEYRTHYEDDLDYLVRNLKDSLIFSKIASDTQLYEGTNGAVVKYYYNECGKIRAGLNQLNKAYKGVAEELSKLKKSCKNCNNTDQLYRDNTNAYRKSMQHYTTLTQEQHSRMMNLKGKLKQSLKANKKEKKQYEKEKRVEDQLYGARADYIRKHYQSLLKLAKSRKSAVNKMRADANKILKKL